MTKPKEANECCGIVGYLGNQDKGGKVCIQGLKILESRGYDSCGIVSITHDDDNQPVFKTTKFASTKRFGGDCIQRMALEGVGNHNHNIAIGHTRWATHGDKTDINAHPHFDRFGRIAIVHNGVIENYHALKCDLKDNHGIIPVSETDTEIIAQVIGLELDNGLELSEAIKAGTDRLLGTFSIVLISILEPDVMYVVKNTGAMVIGVSDGLQAGDHEVQTVFEEEKKSTSKMTTKSKPKAKKDNHQFQIVASDTTVFQDYTKGYYNIEDREMLKISLDKKVESTKLKKVEGQKVIVDLPPEFNHYYTMEMC